MSKIKNIIAREILDSRGNPTIMVEVTTTLNNKGIMKVPSGASTGQFEAFELRDSNSKWFNGKGVSRAVNNVNQIIAPQIIGDNVFDQTKIDQKLIALDGTSNKSSLGANAILGVSVAIVKAAAMDQKKELYEYIQSFFDPFKLKLPMPLLNLINGGQHAMNNLDFQEFMIVPLGAKTFKMAMQMANKVFHNLAKILKKNNKSIQVGDEGGFAPDLNSHEEALDYIVMAIKQAGFQPNKKGSNAIAIALDPAMSELYNGKNYYFKKLAKNNPHNIKTTYTSNEMVKYWEDLVSKYPIISIEDGLDESDWDGFSLLTKRIGDKVQIVGDDLVVTNPVLIAKAIKTKAINSVLIKLNQIGTFSETIQSIKLAQENNMSVIISHRSGETADTTIADLAIGSNAGQIKAGSISRTDRVSKYNRLLIIEDIKKDFIPLAFWKIN